MYNYIYTLNYTYIEHFRTTVVVMIPTDSCGSTLVETTKQTCDVQKHVLPSSNKDCRFDATSSDKSPIFQFFAGYQGCLTCLSVL